jgi:hypothetical protein
MRNIYYFDSLVRFYYLLFRMRDLKPCIIRGHTLIIYHVLTYTNRFVMITTRTNKCRSLVADYNTESYQDFGFVRCVPKTS